MTSISPDAGEGAPDFGPDESPVYSVEVLARITGVASGTILQYHALGLLRATTQSAAHPCFDDDGMRRLRRLESVRETGSMNMSGLCLVARLLDEIEELQDRLRHGR